MRNTIEVDQIAPLPGRVLVRLLDRSEVKGDPFPVIRLRYDPSDDWEYGVVTAVGRDVDGIEVGSRILVRSGGTGHQAGGPAGTDLSSQVGERSGSLVMVLESDIICAVV